MKQIQHVIREPHILAATCYLLCYLFRGILSKVIPGIDAILQWIFLFVPFVILILDAVSSKISFRKANITMLAFFVCAGISSILNAEEMTSDMWFSFVSILMNGYVLLSAVQFVSEEDYSSWLDFLAMITVLYCSLLGLGSVIAYGTYEAGITLPFGLNSEERIFTYGHLHQDSRFCGFFGYSTDGGSLCALSMILSLYLGDRKKLPGWAAVVCVVLAAANILLMDVRTSMLIIAAAVLFVLRLHLGSKYSAKKSNLILFTAVILGVALVAFYKRDSITSFQAEYAENPVRAWDFLSTGRTTYWLEAFQAFLKKPIFGWGWANSTQTEFFDVHNLFFNLLMWTGIAGTALFVFFLIQLLTACHKSHAVLKKQNQIVLILLIAGVLIESMLDRAVMSTLNTSPSTILFWITAGYLLKTGK